MEVPESCATGETIDAIPRRAAWRFLCTNNRTTRRAFVEVVNHGRKSSMRSNTFILLLPLVFGLAGPGAAQTGRDSSAQQSSKDAAFAQKAAAGGEKEVKMAQEAVSKAANADVKPFASRLVKDHTA
jgi:hypothetical protein